MDFSKRIQELTAEFVGREWLLQQVDDFLRDDPKRYLVIVGEAGIGKSAIAARLIQIKKIHAYHFCSVLEGGKLEPIAFVRSLSTQLSQSLPGFSQHIVESSAPHISGKVEVGEMTGGIAAAVYIHHFIVQTKSAAEAFQYLVREPLEAWVTENDPKDPIIILVDSLDEAVRLDRHPNILDLIKLAQDLPQQVRWLLTSRPGKHLSTLSGSRIDVLDKSSKNIRDVQTLISNVLSEPAVSAILKAGDQAARQLNDELRLRSGGNFLYLHFVLTGIRNKAAAGRHLGTIDRLPIGLDGVYKEFLERALGDQANKWGETYRPVLGVLATAQETLSLTQLSAFSGIKPQSVNEVLASLRELLDLATEDESGTSRIFHTSFKDFLTDIEANPDFWLDPQDYHQQISSYYLNTYGGDWEHCDSYGLKYLPSHLSGSASHDKLRELLLDFNWLQAKLTALEVNSVLSDFAFVPDDRELELVKGAIKLAAHNVSTDKTQLAGQLLARLMSYDSPGIQTLLNKASHWKMAKWLRPLTPCLFSPGGHLLNTIKAHSGVVEDLSITADGEKILSAALDRTVKVWNSKTGLELQTLRGHGSSVTGVAVSTDGHVAVSSSIDKTLKVWDLAKGEVRFTLTGHDDWVTCVALADDNRTAVSGSNDKTLRIWDCESGRLLRTLSGHQDHLQDVAVLSRRRRILSASWDRTLRCWDLDTGEELAVLDRTFDLAVTAVAVSPDERIAVWAYGVGQRNPTVKVWDMSENSCLFTFGGHSSMIKSVAVSPDARRVASASWDQTIRIWDLVDGHHLLTFHDNDNLAIVRFLDTRHIISGSYGGNIKFWDIDSQSGELPSGDNGNEITAAAIGASGQTVVGLGNGTIEIRDRNGALKSRTSGSHKYRVTALNITNDEQIFVSASCDGTLKVWELETGALVRTLEGHSSRVWTCSLSEVGRLVISQSEDKVFKIWGLDSGVELKTLVDMNFPYPSTFSRTVDPTKAYIHSVAVTHDGRRLLYSSSTFDSTDEKKMYLSFWDWESDTFQRILTTHIDYINSVAVTADGRLGISASDDYTLEVWDLEELKKLHVLKGHTDWINHVVVTSDGKRAISSTGRGPFNSVPEANLRIWDLRQGVEINSLHAGKNLITALAVTRDGKRVVFTSADGNLQVWDIEIGERVASFNSEFGLFALAVSADGLRIVAGGKTGKIHLFMLEE